jgi:hypothetical protein
LEWLENQNNSKEVDTAPSTPNEEEQTMNFEEATKQIMSVFSDPMFFSD